jgi:hypothetical protein
MRMTRARKRTLAEIFSKRMASLAFAEDRVVSTWSEYLSGIGCRRVHLRAQMKRPLKGFLFVEDPIWSSVAIMVPREVALKALVLGLP